nr:protein FAR1-RELATED SEQUENCE 5-like [Ipomoea batatas]
MTLTADGKEVEYIPYEEGSDREINRANEAKRKEEEEILERQRIEQKKFEEMKAKMESAVNITQANNDILKIRSINQIMGETDMEVISEQNFGKTLHENADRNTMQVRGLVVPLPSIVSDYSIMKKTSIMMCMWVKITRMKIEVGEYECIPDCAESIKPYLGQRFQTLDEGVRYYKEYAAFVRASTMKKNRYGDVEVKYLLCSREGYTVAKAQSSSTVVEGNRANINTRRRVSNKHVLVVLKDDDAEMISPKYVVQRWTKNGNAKETEANTKYNDENKLVGKVWIEFNNYMALSKGNIKDLQGILNFMQGKKGKMMKRKGMIEAKRKSSDLVETFYGTQTSTTIK